MNSSSFTGGEPRHRSRLSDGLASWGSVVFCADRRGLIRYRLTIYQPGLSPTERCLLKAWRGWPLWGGLVWLAIAVVMSHVSGPWAALALATAVYLGGGIATYAAAGETRTAARTVSLVMLAGHHDPVHLAAHERLQLLACRMAEAEERRKDGRLSRVDYEDVWWQAYTGLAAEQNLSTRRRHCGARYSVNQMLQILMLMAVPTAVLLILRYAVKCQERHAPTVFRDSVTPPRQGND